MSRPAITLAALAICAVLPAQAATLAFRAQISPASEVPPATGAGHGSMAAQLDTVTHKLTYTLTYEGFAVPITMAHLHGPAAAGVNAGVQIPLATGAVASPIKGVATLTPAQETQLEAGQWYANLHTAVFPKGAARGQVLPAT